MRTEEIKLLDYLHIIRRHVRLIGVVTITATVIAAIISCFLPKTYQSSTVLLPISAKRGGGMAMAVTAQLGALGSLVDTGGGASGSQLMALLKSRTLAERVLQRFHLEPVLQTEGTPLPLDELAKRLHLLMGFSEDKKTQTISVSAIGTSPQQAAEIANGYVDELQKFIRDYSFTQAKRYRIYIEEQLAKNKEELLEAGKELNTFYKDGRVSSTESKIDVPIEFTVNHESSATDLQTIQETYSALEKSSTPIPDALAPSGRSTVVKGVPQQVYFQYKMLRRELLGKMSAMLAQQYETAKMEEAKDDLAFQVLDPARPPLAKLKPQRTTIVCMTALLAFMSSVIGVFLIEQFSQIRRQRE